MRACFAGIVFISALASPASALAGSGAKMVRMVTIEDITFRVVIDGQYAKVASKGSAWFAPVGARYFALARRAVEQASGCKVTETDNFRATLYVSLDCSRGVPIDSPSLGSE